MSKALLIGMTVGPQTHSRWGLRGSEDLGGGLSAIFRFENGFELGDGKLHVQNTLFSRQAYVGLSSNRYGSLTFGNQYAPLYDTLGDIFDPMTVGDYWQDSWMYNGIGNFLTVRNSVKYTFSYNGLGIDAIYGFGNHAGAMGFDSTYGVALTYAQGPASVDAGFQQTSVSSLNGSAVNGASSKRRIGRPRRPSRIIRLPAAFPASDAGSPPRRRVPPR
ncbi:gram-negative porin family protein [Burkholderia thailandensis MSMB121]|nr:MULTISPECIES: porin [Burkholderia]AGK50466.1 gram-negative porin family protein [Burkholderia thailandensis MSMB121]ATF33804.1 porin [Burkholderia thailandensis]KST71885.1 porin [Burkholderia humptydooensis]KVN06775.1 porin [Burkholderia sp. MSMB1552]KWZ50003.1 porin [Burkholderia sp. MSMB1588]